MGDVCEDVGSIVRWIGHDAPIFGGNSGGPLVNMRGEIVGVNEISLGLAGAIPADLARDVVNAILKEKEVQDFLEQNGADPVGGSPQDYARIIRNDLDLWGPVVRRANVQAD